MKRAFLVLLCACSPHVPHTVEIAAPLVMAAVPVHDELVLPRSATRIGAAESGPWAADFPPSKTFAVYDLPDARRVLFTWRVGKSRFDKRAGDDDDETDYPANHVAPVDLVVRGRNETRPIAFGELSGGVEPRALSWCGGKPLHPAFAATFSIGMAQGDDEMVLVRDGRTLHVLHRVTNDGFCADAKQGPLDVCQEFQWERAADVRIAQGAELYENVEVDGKTFECGME